MQEAFCEIINISPKRDRIRVWAEFYKKRMIEHRKKR